ncbi:e9imm peptide [Streptomyces sp. NPDC006430]|uniref:e9imm peptide n=1 Tax=Streptomyces sp. NPDC006430 TaxID=3154299 RepID=UPI0033B8D240
MDGSITDEAEADATLDALKQGLRCPHVSDYIYWDFDPALSAEKVVDRAMAYKPFAL